MWIKKTFWLLFNYILGDRVGIESMRELNDGIERVRGSEVRDSEVRDSEVRDYSTHIVIQL